MSYYLNIKFFLPMEIFYRNKQYRLYDMSIYAKQKFKIDKFKRISHILYITNY